MLGLFYEMTLGKINLKYGVPTGIRTPVTAVKGRCPRPLDDRDTSEGARIIGGIKKYVKPFF